MGFLISITEMLFRFLVSKIYSDFSEKDIGSIALHIKIRRGNVLSNSNSMSLRQKILRETMRYYKNKL